MAEKCVGMGSWVSTSQFKYLLRMNELYKRERESSFSEIHIAARNF